jgi:predicted helicase/very-short-patch-repair endonuclease
MPTKPSENDNNKNREYPEIDKRIKDSFVKYSNVHKTKVYDMYARFYRWAMDRLDDNGIIAFITNRSFVDSRTFDGFRQCIQQDFDYAYIIDTRSDVRANPKIAGTTHNVFGIQTGVAILFLVKIAKPVTKNSKQEKTRCRINYIALDDFMRKEDKLHWLATNPLKDIPFELVQPDKNNNWINMADNDFEKLLPLALPKLSGKKNSKDKKSIFEIMSFGCVSNRDEWVYDFDEKELTNKVNYYLDAYEKTRKQLVRPLEANWYNKLGNEIKWSQDIRNYLEKDIKLVFNENSTKESLYRPFTKKKYYYSKWLNWSLYQTPLIFGQNGELENKVMIFTDAGSQKPFMVGSSSIVSDLHFVGAACGSQNLPLYRYDAAGNRQDNITDWGLNQFRKYYKSLKPSPSPHGEEEGNSGSAERSSPVCYVDSAEVQEAYKPLNPDPSPHGGEGGNSGGDPLGTRGVPGHLIAFARQLRKDSTDAEDILWQLLRNRQLNGAKFRRQHPVGTGYILDFYCAEHRLAIEVDGSIHDLPEQAAYDAERTQHLEQFNVKVIRFSNAEVLTQTEWVLSVITTYLSSAAALLPQGEGSGTRGQRRARTIQKEDIFHYVYAVLHHPAYRTKYELNLKREFPRIPLYDDFWQWAAWGKTLLDLHINYESVEPYPLTPTLSLGEKAGVRAKLKADKEQGIITLDEQTTLRGIPAEAWRYKLGNRSALEWILDQYKESKPKDPTIAEKFNTYRFADYKEQVIDLLKRVTTVSVETMKVVGEMPVV